jgi:HEXXH motif-containing protein
MSGHPVESTNVAPRHHVARSVIEQVFAGSVDTATVAALRDGQRSRRLRLLKELRESVASAPPAPDGSSIENSWAILVAAEKRAPETVRQILSYPSVGTWLVRVIRKIRGIVVDDVPVWVDMGYLNSIAAAAAIRAGIDVEAAVPVWRGRINLPTVGQFEVAGGDYPRMTRLRVADSTSFLESGEGGWIPLDEVQAFPLRSHRSTAAGRTMSWTVDDIDPYRTFADVEGPARLTTDEFENWRRRLDDAWNILVEEHPEHVQEVTAAEPVIVPVAPDGGFVASSSSSAFGAICLATPESPHALAETLVHELQHSKLNALIDLVPLQRPGADRLCFAPWRRDPRPLSGLLHGVYAFVGVTEYWHRQLLAHPESSASATGFHFAHHRAQVHEALRWLGSAPELTEAGARFLEVASARLAACDEVVVAEQLRDVITMLCAENRLAWQLRHLAPPVDHVAELADLWRADERPTIPRVSSVLTPFNRRDSRSLLSRLLTARALDLDHPPAEPGTEGEFALVNGASAAATAAFGARIRTDPDDDGAWVGLLMAMGRHNASDSPPETVSATYREISAVSGTAPDPVTLADWFADC